MLAPTSVRDVTQCPSTGGRTRSTRRNGRRYWLWWVAGPAGLATAVLPPAGPSERSAIESEAIGGRSRDLSMIRNLGFPGIPVPSSPTGAVPKRCALARPLLHRLAGHRRQDRRRREPHVVCTEGGDVRARAIVIACGVDYPGSTFRLSMRRRLRRRYGRGDDGGPVRWRDYDVPAVGGGNSAGRLQVFPAASCDRDRPPPPLAGSERDHVAVSDRRSVQPANHGARQTPVSSTAAAPTLECRN